MVFIRIISTNIAIFMYDISLLRFAVASDRLISPSAFDKKATALFFAWVWWWCRRCLISAIDVDIKRWQINITFRGSQSSRFVISRHHFAEIIRAVASLSPFDIFYCRCRLSKIWEIAFHLNIIILCRSGNVSWLPANIDIFREQFPLIWIVRL